ncbi:DUF389 domain-containing protein [Rhodococcus sp. NPDC058514]|uniref:DUF389 domain-containing protein n=1 Tax=unclassified Rhodococcus (in: high G+C Gram-positive bacteria) TaxID=192944 RepID=UPI00365EA111
MLAPLATPILGIGLGIATGRMRLLGRSMVVVFLGVGMVVAMGAVFAQLIPDPTGVLSNSQVLGRTSPRLADLMAVGAFVLFLSNVVALVITATGVFVAAGYAAEAGGGSGKRGRAYVTLAAALLVVAIPMTANTLSSLWAQQIAEAGRNWLADVPGAQVTDVSWQGHTATVAVFGPSALPPISELQAAVDDLLPWRPGLQVVHTMGTRIAGE